jgi:3-hydroxyacyl-CoA dehydrogenase/enoyl-CoA hydratase/carnithine racemase
VPETEFKLQPAETTAGPVALLTIDNGADHTKPTLFGHAALESLERAVEQLEAGEWAGLVVTGKPFVFAAGADLDELPRLRTAEEAEAASRAGHELFGRIRALPFPTLAAINGACLGGGLELALHCDYRTVSTAVRHIAFPEVFLGIVPAWGGTQLLPRLVGPAAAVKLIVENPLRRNRMIDAAAAHELGLADALFEPAEFLDDSLAILVSTSHGQGQAPAVAARDDMEEATRRARALVDDEVHGAAPAPYRALDLIAGSASWSLEEGYRAEEEALGDLLTSRQARASLYAFDLVERRTKREPGRPTAASRAVARVGIVGAGSMATQLTALILRRLQLPLVLRDVEQGIVDEALEAVRAELSHQAARGRLDEGTARFLGSLASGGTELEPFAGCDLVLEAVVEDLEVKQDVFAELRAIVSPKCVLATNTSALSVAEIGADVGMHFFNPVALLPLVELVRTEQTDEAALATAWDVAMRLRKQPVLVRDAPAFVVNRVLTRMLTAILDALEHGNSLEETDEALLRLGLPMAPSVLLQMVGPRIANHVLETLHDAYPHRFPLSPTLQNYADGRDEIVVLVEQPRTVDEITEAALEAMADEIRHLLEEGVVIEAADVDTCLLLGAGFPFFLGGITKFLDQTGVSERVTGRPLAEIRGVAAPCRGRARVTS